MDSIPKYYYRLFKSVQNLEDYLDISIENLNIPPQQKKLLEDLSKEILIVKTHDDVCYSEMIDWKEGNDAESPTSKVKNENDTVITTDRNEFDINEILEKLASEVLESWKIKNTLFSGCFMGGKFNKIGLVSKFKNTVINDLKTKEAWSVLLNCIGEIRFRRLLLDYVILCRLQNNAYYQLSGQTLSINLHSGNNDAKKEKQAKKDHLQEFKSTFLFDISDPSSNLSKYFEKILATNKKRSREMDSLKTVKLSRRQKRKLNDEKKRANIRKDEKLSVDRQLKREEDDKTIDRAIMFYAETIINTKTSQPLSALPNSHMFHRRHVQNDHFIHHCMTKIFPLEFKTPRKERKFCSRFVEVPSMIVDIYKRHSKTSSIKILNARCPRMEGNVNVEGGSSSYTQVTGFVIEQLKRSFPMCFWGCRENMDVIRIAVEHFVSRGKTEKITIKEIVNKFKSTKCKWLTPPSNTTRIVPTDLEKRNSVLQQALQWLFNGYIIPLLRSMFYITEHASNPKKVYYFRRDVWHDLSQPKLLSIVSESFKQCDPSELTKLALGVCKIRLLPKADGFRIITNSSKTLKYIKDEQTGKISPVKCSANEELLPVLDALKFKKDQNPELMGSSVLGKHLFFKRLKEYKKTRVTPDSKFYFIKADIASCFDNIDQKKLLKILEDILKVDKNYMYRNIESARPKKCYTSAGTSDDMDHLADFSEKAKGIRPGSILIDKNTYHAKTVEQLVSLLKENIESNTVKIGDNFYKRIKGIAQGSSLSTLLCSLFFGDLEKQKGLVFTKNDDDGILFTYVDDFLYITENPAYAGWFSRAIVEETNKIHIKANKDKCITNIEKDVAEFSWLGYKINTKNLDVYLDIPANYKYDIQNSTTIEYGKNPGKALLNSALRNIKSQFHDILMDGDFNSKEALLRNLYENFSLTALKMVNQASQLSRSIIGFVKEMYLFEGIMRLGQVVLKLVPSGLNPNDVLHVFFKAFSEAFSPKQTKFPDVTYCLKYLLDRYNRAMGISQPKLQLPKKRKKAHPSTSTAGNNGQSRSKKSKII